MRFTRGKQDRDADELESRQLDAKIVREPEPGELLGHLGQTQPGHIHETHLGGEEGIEDPVSDHRAF